jgi:hypothetical protein
MNDLLMGLLISGAIQCQGYGSRTDQSWNGFVRELQQAWLDFIAANRQALREGKWFKVGDLPLRPEMFPPFLEFDLHDGSHWPSKTKPAMRLAPENVQSGEQAPIVKPATPTVVN